MSTQTDGALPETLSGTGGTSPVTKPPTLPGHVMSWLVLILGAVGLFGSSLLSIEKYEVLKDPNHVPSCSLNPVISCGAIIKSPQAAFFGFPNPIIGIGAFAVIVVTGVLSVARVPLPRWYWAGQVLGLVAGMVFVHFLSFSAIFRIHALCPYCMVVWAVTAALLATSISVWANLGKNESVKSIAGWIWVVLAVWYIALIVIILDRFWYYWSTLI